MSNVVSDVTGMFGSGIRRGVSWLDQQWTQRLFQVSVYACIVFYIVSDYDLLSWMEKTLEKVLNIKAGKNGTRFVHAILFGFLMFFGTRLLLDPIFKQIANGRVVEGNKYPDDDDGDDTQVDQDDYDNHPTE